MSMVSGDLRIDSQLSRIQEISLMKSRQTPRKTVLKPGTAYQIYKVTDEGEEMVKQSYSNGQGINRPNWMKG